MSSLAHPTGVVGRAGGGHSLNPFSKVVHLNPNLPSIFNARRSLNSGCRRCWPGTGVSRIKYSPGVSDVGLAAGVVTALCLM